MLKCFFRFFLLVPPGGSQWPLSCTDRQDLNLTPNKVEGVLSFVFFFSDSPKTPDFFESSTPLPFEMKTVFAFSGSRPVLDTAHAL